MSKSAIFKFKQFDVDQSGCAMKINTDGVLLGALADADQPKTILDIGTGTGVIALMLAQRFPDAQIDAVEIDEQAAQTAARNFRGSPFARRLTVYPVGFEQFFSQNLGKQYDLIVSNPPFYINSLKSPKKEKEVAKHADRGFFENLVKGVVNHLNEKGTFCLILPIETAELMSSTASDYGLFLNRTISINSYDQSEAHRLILYHGFGGPGESKDRFVIYKSEGEYSEEYVKLLQPYFTIF